MLIPVSPDWRLSHPLHSQFGDPQRYCFQAYISQKRGFSFPSIWPSWTLRPRNGTRWTCAPKTLALRLDVILFLLKNQTKYLLFLGWMHRPYVSLLNCSLMEYMSTLWIRLGVDLALNTAYKLALVTLHLAAHFAMGPKLCGWTLEGFLLCFSPYTRTMRVSSLSPGL